MTENPGTTQPTDGYDPATDPDADPDSLSPRTGTAAIPDADEDAGDPRRRPRHAQPARGLIGRPVRQRARRSTTPPYTPGTPMATGTIARRSGDAAHPTSPVVSTR